MDHDDWGRLVAGAVARIDDGALGKVVLARQIAVTANRPFVTSDVLSRLLALYPTCMVFRVDGFLGASPDLLIERGGTHVASHPLAGPSAAAATWLPTKRSLPGCSPHPRSAESTPMSSKVSAAPWALSACPRTLRLMMATLTVRMRVQEKAPPVVFRRGFGVRGGGLVVSLP